MLHRAPSKDFLTNKKTVRLFPEALLAPFALGYQPNGADWESQTTNNVATRIPVAVVALVAFALFSSGGGCSVCSVNQHSHPRDQLARAA
jgi:hypothetical protein